MQHARYIEVDAEVRYWEDAHVNGKEDTDGRIPLRVGECWRPVIDLENGRVIGWPEGMTADVHYKVCDAGLYWLQDDSGKRIAKYGSSYVPSRFLCVGDNGYGDYIILKIGADGLITGWKKPTVDPEQWHDV
jgi:hypothetical protein